MNSDATINRDFEELAEVTGTRKEELEVMMSGDYLPDALGKFIRNLAKCLGSYKESIAKEALDGKTL